MVWKGESSPDSDPVWSSIMNDAVVGGARGHCCCLARGVNNYQVGAEQSHMENGPLARKKVWRGHVKLIRFPLAHESTCDGYNC